MKVMKIGNVDSRHLSSLLTSPLTITLFIFNFTSPNIYIQSSSMKISDDGVWRRLLLYPDRWHCCLLTFELSHAPHKIQKTRGIFFGILKLRTTHLPKTLITNPHL